jgi:hypothetical protein
MTKVLKSSFTHRVAMLAAIVAFTAGAVVGDQAPFSAHASAPTVALTVKGNHLVDQSGAPWTARGVNRSGTEYACIQGWGFFDGPSDDASIAAIAAWHTNAVRVPLNEDCWLNINGVNPSYGGANYINAIHDDVTRLNNAGLVAILELHWSAPGTTTATGQNPMPDADHSPAFWQGVANTFKGNQSVIFDLFNEPYPDNNSDSTAAWTCWKSGGTCSGVAYQAAGMQQLVDAVRGTGSTNVIMLGGVQYANSQTQWATYKPTDPLNQLVVSSHDYPNQACSTTTCWQAGLGTLAQQYPVIIGETGDHNCTTISFLPTILPWADAHGIGYLGWTWNTWGSCGDNVLIQDYSGTPTSGGGQYFHDHLAAVGPVDTTAPSAPTGLATSGRTTSSINLTWSASSDNVGVSGYDIYRDNAKIASATTTTYSDAGLAPSTTHSYTVVARDAAGNLSAPSTTLSVSTQPSNDSVAPVVSILSPAAGSRIGSRTTVKGSSTDSSGVVKMSVYIDGTLRASNTNSNSISYTWNSRRLTAGSHTITIMASDAAGNIGTSSETVYR